MITAAVRRCLVELDVAGMRELWRASSPHLPQPATDEDALCALHMARTAAASVPLNLRFYSHRWLLERSLPSQLPNPLKPHAERVYPRVVSGVGIAVQSQYPEVVIGIRGAMEHAVSDCYANGDTDPLIVRPQMMAARAKERKALGLNRRGE